MPLYGKKGIQHQNRGGNAYVSTQSKYTPAPRCTGANPGTISPARCNSPKCDMTHSKQTCCYHTPFEPHIGQQKRRLGVSPGRELGTPQATAQFSVQRGHTPRAYHRMICQEESNLCSGQAQYVSPLQAGCKPIASPLQVYQEPIAQLLQAHCKPVASLLSA